MIVLIDGNNLAYRNFAAHAALSTRRGVKTGAVFGSLVSVCKITSHYAPDAIVVFWDGHDRKSGWRKRLYRDYKAQRVEQDPQAHSDYRVQLDRLRVAFDLLGFPQTSVRAVEADDLIGIATAELEARGESSLIVSSDKDFYQLLSSRVSICRKGHEQYTTASFVREFAISPSQWVDARALMGDASDNIHGVATIGEKRALALIKEYGAIEGIMLARVASDARTSFAKRVQEQSSAVLLNRLLVTIPRSASKEYYDDEQRSRILTAVRSTSMQNAGFDRRRFETFCRVYELHSIQEEMNVWERLFQRRKSA
jgi:5'-3' exonuclease